MEAQATAAAAPMKTDAAKAAYTDEECNNRFDTISRTGAIYFSLGSALEKLLNNAEVLMKFGTS